MLEKGFTRVPSAMITVFGRGKAECEGVDMKEVFQG
jgi:hypothetical protein